MKNTIILIIGIFILISCKEQKQQVEEFLFDVSKMTSKTKFSYTYDSNKLTSQTEKYYTIILGQVVDSIETETEFVYNNKGLLIKEITPSDFEENPSVKIYDYDINDSLISEISINNENDTVLWEEYKYYPDGKKTVFHRYLSVHFDPNQDFMEAMENKQLDTSFYRNEFVYEDNLCKTQKQFDNKGKLVKNISFDYKENQLIKETHLTYLNDIGMTEKIKTYDYSKSELKPDFYSLDFKNDTLELYINEFSEGQLNSLTEIYEYGQNINKTFYEKGKEIGMIGIDLNMQFKIVDSYEYYEDGTFKEIQTYNEQINNAN